MPRASGSTPLPAPVRARLVVKHQEVVIVPASRVVADHRRLALAEEVFNGHKEDALVDFGFGGSGLLSKLGRPLVTHIGVVALVLLRPPRISHLHDTGAV